MMISGSTRTSRTAAQLSVVLFIAAISASSTAWPQHLLMEDDFESGIDQWTRLHEETVSIVREEGTENHVLELRSANIFPPVRTKGYSNARIAASDSFENVRMEGRFNFPTDGHGYLGFIYNHQASNARTDFGVVYVKSNGSYVRVSPHYDGGPSWRLYEEMKTALSGDRRIQFGRWHQFRLDVRGTLAELYIDDMDKPIVTFDHFPNTSGALGLEARPGTGEPVWVDDIRVTAIPDRSSASAVESQSDHCDWESNGLTDAFDSDFSKLPQLADDEWRKFDPDPRGALITAALTQTASGEKNVVYLRCDFDAGTDPLPGWLAFSSANRLDVWLNGYYRGTVAPDPYIWRDHLTNPRHPGSKLAVIPDPGVNQILIRVHDHRFAGGGFYVAVLPSS